MIARGALAGMLLALLACGKTPETYTVEAGATASFPVDASAGRWPGWGGPGGDFKVETTGLADGWPTQGPPLVWSRALGPGYSAIAAGGGTLFTMYRDGDADVVVALRAGDGTTVWEHRYPAATHPDNATEFGEGPNATPLLLDDRIVALGYTGVLSCLDLQTGRPLWSRHLIRDLGGDVLDFGYSASPIVHGGRLIVLVGGEQRGAAALDPADGSLLWSGPATSVSYATPIVIDVDGQEQIVYFSADEIIGLDPRDGELLWSHPVVNQYRNNSTGPLWGADNLLWAATQLDGGTRALRLTRQGSATHVEQMWVSQRLSIHFWNALRLGDHVYASVGSNGSILAGIELRSGEIVWRRRGFEQVNFVHAGDRTILLDAEGHLALARLAPAGIEILAQARILDGPTWTVPTLVDTTLYVRDQQSIRALDLGREPGSG